MAQSGQTSEAIIAEQGLLGSDNEEERSRDLLPFTRALGASGTVSGSFAASAAAAGVPRAAMLEALQALDAATEGASAARAPQDGDTFYVRWEQAYTIDGHPIGVGRVLWLELRAESGATTALHRFQPRESGEQFF